MDWQAYAMLGVLAALVLSAPLISARVREYRLSRAGLDNLPDMTDQMMVQHMARILGALGYRVFRPPTGAGEKDPVVADGLGQRRSVVVRHWRTRIDEEAVIRAVAAAKQEAYAAPMLVSVEGYNWKAREAGAREGAILWSLTDLAQAIGRIRQSAVAAPELPHLRSAPGQLVRQEPPSVEEPRPDPLLTLVEPLPGAVDVGGEFEAPRGRETDRPRFWGRKKPKAPFCPKCGRRMVVRRNAEHKEYWGCPHYPHCIGTRPKL